MMLRACEGSESGNIMFPNETVHHMPSHPCEFASFFNILRPITVTYTHDTRLGGGEKDNTCII